MSATSQHAVIEALVAKWAEALDAPVYDGASVEDGDQFTGIWVGFDPINEDSLAVTSGQEYVHIGTRGKEETGTVNCLVASWSGDAETYGRRVIVADLLSEMEAVVRADPSLGGVCVTANFGANVRLHQHLFDDGKRAGNEVFAVVSVDFLSRI